MDKTSTKIIIQSLMILADDIESGDGVANAALRQAAGRMKRLNDLAWKVARDARHNPDMMIGIATSALDLLDFMEDTE